MMGVRKRAVQKTHRDSVARFRGFSILGNAENKPGILRAKEAHNCDCRNGVLRRGVGIRTCKLEDGSAFLISTSLQVTNVYHTAMNGSVAKDTEAYFVATENGYLYRIDIDTGRARVKKIFSKPPVYYALRDKTKKIQHTFTSDTEGVYTSTAEIFIAVSTGDIKGGCVVGGRYFVAKNNRVLEYSASYLSDMFGGGSNDGGTLYLPKGEGEIIDLQTDGEYLYIFLEREIYRLTVKAEISDFYLERLAYAGGEICVSSMAATANGVIFLSLSGAYFLKGKEVKKICRHLPVRPTDEKEPCSVGFCGELAMIDYTTFDGDGEKVKRRLAISTDGEDGFFCERYGLLGGNDFCVVGGILHRFAQNAEETIYQRLPCFTTEELDFGTKKRKRLKKLRLEGDGGVEVNLHTQGRTRRYTAQFQNGVAEIPLREQGEKFSFSFFPNERSQVRALEVEYTHTEV